MSKGKLFVISGASGVGKSTVLSKVMAARPDLSFSVSATTRDPRPGEVDGKHYFFISKECFEEMIKNDEFLEYDAHAANYYGTLKGQAEAKMKTGHVLLDIEPKGARQVKDAASEAVLMAAEALQPDAILCVGQAGGRAAVTPERIGVNIRDARIPDNAGNQPIGQFVTEDGPAAYFSTVPVMEMAAAIQAKNIPATVSNSAGAFVCNDVLYSLLHHFAETEVKVGFIHVPFLPQQGQPSLPLPQITDALLHLFKGGFGLHAAVQQVVVFGGEIGSDLFHDIVLGGAVDRARKAGLYQFAQLLVHSLSCLLQQSRYGSGSR